MTHDGDVCGSDAVKLVLRRGVVVQLRATPFSGPFSSLDMVKEPIQYEERKGEGDDDRVDRRCKWRHVRYITNCRHFKAKGLETDSPSLFFL